VNQRQDALAEIVAIARHNELSSDDIVDALKILTPGDPSPDGGIVRRLLAYIGGIFVFAGIAVYIAMFWADMNSASRIIITLGTGLVALVLAILLEDHDKFSRAATPLFLVAAWLQPTGIMVAFDELGAGGDPQHAALATTTVMLLQQILVMRRFQRSVLLFIALIFGTLTFLNAFDLMSVDRDVNFMIVGLSLLLVSYGIDKTGYSDITPFWYFIGGAALLWAAFELLKHTPVHVLYLGLAAFIIYVSTLVKSRTLLFVSTLAMIGYLGYFTAEYFVDSTGWPVALIFMGLVLIGLSNMALRINRRYIDGA
jgi:hypothetical protein